jgi:very-short-patch-repair endonuclease
MTARAPWGAAGELAASRHGAFHRRQAAESGLTPSVIARLIREGVLAEPVPGVLVVTGSPDTWHRRLAIATAVGTARVVAGFRSAAALHRLDGYEPGPLELILERRKRIALPGVVVHHGPLSAVDVTVVDGIECTTIARTLADLGTVDPPHVVEGAFNDAWRRRVSLAGMRSTAERLHRPGQAGTRVLLEILDAAESRTRPLESPLEGRVERLLERAAVRGLVRQHVVVAPDGSFVARVDFAVPDLRLAFEAHSARHHTGRAAAVRDDSRDDRLLAVGWTAEYLTQADLHQSSETEARVRAVVRERAHALALRWDRSSRRWVAA